MNIYGTIIGRVYGEYTITSFLGNFGACANIMDTRPLSPLRGLGTRLPEVHARAQNTFDFFSYLVCNFYLVCN